MHPAQVDDLVRRLVANPNDQAALGAAYQEGQHDPRGYATILERVGEGAQDATYAAYWLSEAAHVWSTTLGDARRAATLLMKAIDRDPASDVASDRLASLYREKQDHRALVALLERRAKALAGIANGDPTLVQRASMLHEEAARLWQDAPLSQSRKAVENYKKAFEIDPGAVSAIYAARELLKAEGNYKEAIPLYEAEIQAIDDTERKLALYRDEALVRAEHGDPKGGTAALRNALALDPQDTGLQYELAMSIVTRIQGGADAVDASEKHEAAELLVGMSQAYDGEHALAYAEAALDAEPEHDRAMQLVGYWARELGRTDGIEGRYRAYVDANPDGVIALEARQFLGQAYEAAGRFDDAIEVLEPLKDDQEVSFKLGELYAKAGRTEQAAALMDRHAAALPPAERVGKQLEIAAMLAQQGDKKGALAKYREILEVDPQHPEALTYVEDALRAARQYKDLRDVLLSAARTGGASVESRRAQLREVAGLSETQLRDPEGAIVAYRQMLSLDRADESARAALHRLLEKAQRWDDLAALFEQEAMAAADVEERITLERRLADLHEHKRGDKREAAEALLRVVMSAPKDEESLQRAVEMLRAVGDSERAAQAIDENVGPLDAGPAKGQLLAELGELRDRSGDHGGAADAYAEAAAILRDASMWQACEEQARRSERWELAASACGRRADLEKDPKARARLCAAESEYHLQAGDAQSALARLEQATELAPADEELGSRLEQFYEREGRLDDLATYLVRCAEEASDATRSIALFKRASTFRRERLADPDGARDLLLRVVSAYDDADALSMLADDAASRDDFRGAIAYLERLEPMAEGRTAKVRLGLRRAAMLSDGLGDVDGAVAAYHRLLETLDENCREALQAIADLEQARERYPQAADALERDLELASAGEEKANIARRLGEIYIEHTRELGKSLAAFETVLKEDPEDFAALAKLRELSERAEKWPRVLELIDAQIEVEGDDDEIAALTARKAEVLADQMGQPEAALRTLAPLTMAGSDVARATAMAIADRHEADAQIGGQILAWARTTSGPEGQRLLGEAFDRFVGGGALDRALEIAPDVLRTPRGKDAGFLGQLEPLAVSAKASELVLEIHDRRGAGLSGLARAQELIRQAKVRIELGVDRREALEHGEIGLSAVPPSEAGPLLSQLADLAPDGASAVELLERHVGRCKQPADRLAAMVRAYRRAVTTAGVPDEKVKELAEHALGVQGPNLEDAFDALWAEAREADATDGTADRRRALLDVLVTTTAGPRDGGRTRSAQLRRAAEWMRAEAGDDEAAFELLARSLVAHVDAATLDAIEQSADPARAASIFTRTLEEVFDGPLVRQILSRRAALRYDKLGDIDGAMRDLKKLHELAPADQGITDRYRAVLEEANDYRGIIQLAEDQILRSKDQGVRADLARSIARLWEERIGDARETADAWRRVLRLKPQDPEGTAGLDRAKRNKLQFEEGKFPPQRAPVAEASIAPPAMRPQGFKSFAKKGEPARPALRRSSAPPTDAEPTSSRPPPPPRVPHISSIPPAADGETETALQALPAASANASEHTTPEDDIETGVVAIGARTLTEVEVPVAPEAMLEPTAEFEYDPATSEGDPVPPEGAPSDASASEPVAASAADATDASAVEPTDVEEVVDDDLATVVGASPLLSEPQQTEDDDRATPVPAQAQPEPAQAQPEPAQQDVAPAQAAGNPSPTDAADEVVEADEVEEIVDDAEILDDEET
jgi:tetratricopeptide (TPR) repeat protein